MKLFEKAIYTIAKRELIEAALSKGGSGELHEHSRWTTGSDLLLKASEGNERLPLLLGDAILIRGVEWAGLIDEIELTGAGETIVSFSGLRPLPQSIARDKLIKLSDGVPLSKAYIRPYVPCHLPNEAGLDVLLTESKAEGHLDFLEAQAEIEDDPKCAGLSDTTRLALVNARIGQGNYRKRVLELWSARCAVSDCSIDTVLVASHIKPWSMSTNEERLDQYNGLLLAASIDRLFDEGLISFSDDGAILLSSKVSQEDLQVLGLGKHPRLRTVLPRHIPYLKAHREANGFDDDLASE